MEYFIYTKYRFDKRFRSYGFGSDNQESLILQIDKLIKNDNERGISGKTYEVRDKKHNIYYIAKTN